MSSGGDRSIGMATKTKRPNASGKMNSQAANVSFCLLVKAYAAT